jgi:hypothetical protein
MKRSVLVIILGGTVALATVLVPAQYRFAGGDSRVSSQEETVRDEAEVTRTLRYGELPEILKRVCACESSWSGRPDDEPRQYNPDGTIRVHKNKNGTTDFGMCQVNDFWWGKEANAMGYDYKNDERDNAEMAKHILNVQGLDAWSWSRECWK